MFRALEAQGEWKEAGDNIVQFFIVFFYTTSGAKSSDGMNLVVDVLYQLTFFKGFWCQSKHRIDRRNLTISYSIT